MSHSNPETNGIIRKYSKLVYKVLHDKFPMYTNDDDLIQVGYIALWKAADKYDPKRSRFSTYAYHCVFNAMVKELGHRKPGNTVSLNQPVKVGDWVGELQDTIEDIKASPDGMNLAVDLDEFFKSLTKRQQTILGMKMYGHTGLEIARELGISKSLVTKELQAINELWEDFEE